MAPEINLLPHIERPSPGRRWLTIILAAAFVLLVIYLTLQYLSLNKTIQTLQSEEQQLQAEKAELETSIIDLDAPVKIDLATSVEFVESVSYPVSPLLIEVNKYANENTYLRNYVFSESTINFAVDFETLAEVVTYVSDLSSSPYFQDVKVEQIYTFDPAPSDEEEDEETETFEKVERFSNELTVVIDPYYIRTGGVAE
ncbi:PilN domain-containing protein [Sporosarcina jiandibaonis]|uniref:PilN domain-containing protein n=1 Tax=Sporosarcina jiandibaonis TaxID=2715535 RepID=UPI00155682B9|nr:hypothetical protein [Sporosarcina jiandibaonis]